MFGENKNENEQTGEIKILKKSKS